MHISLPFILTSDRMQSIMYVILLFQKCNIKSTNPANQNTPSSPLLPSFLPTPSLASEKLTKPTIHPFFFPIYSLEDNYSKQSTFKSVKYLKRVGEKLVSGGQGPSFKLLRDGWQLWMGLASIRYLGPPPRTSNFYGNSLRGLNMLHAAAFQIHRHKLSIC